MPKSYDQYCPVAGALDLVGERWTLLIVRELMYGPLRFTDLREGLPGIPPNLLSARLRELEDAALIRRRELPAPAARSVYELTDEGRGLEPTLRALARWGMHRLPPPDDGEVSPLAAVRAGLVAYARPPAARSPARTWAVHVGEEAFTLQLADGRVSCWRGEPDRADLVVSAGAADLIRLRRGDGGAGTGRPAISYQAPDEELVAEFEAVFNLGPSEGRRESTGAGGGPGRAGGRGLW